MSPTQTPDYPIIDGFLYNTLLRPNLTYVAMVLKEYAALRQSGAYRTFWLPTPLNSQVSIPAQGDYTFQHKVHPGSAFWGWIFTASTPGNFSVQVTDPSIGVSIFQEVCNAQKSTGKVNPGQGKQNLLSKLLIVGQKGLLNVEICNLGGAASNVQFILCGAMPVPQEECVTYNIVEPQLAS